MKFIVICNSCGSSAEVNHDLDEFKFEISNCGFCGDDDIDSELQDEITDD